MTCSRRAGSQRPTTGAGAVTWRTGRPMERRDLPPPAPAHPDRRPCGPTRCEPAAGGSRRETDGSTRPCAGSGETRRLDRPPLPTPPNRPRSRCRRSWSVVSGVRSSCAATVRKFSRTTRASSAARRARSLEWQRMLKPTPMERNTAVAMAAGSDSVGTPGGSRKRTFTIAAPETVQTSPGKSPPYQALMKLAPWKSMNGTISSDGRRTACSAAAPPSEAATTAQDRMRALASLMLPHHGCDRPPVNGRSASACARRAIERMSGVGFSRF